MPAPVREHIKATDTRGDLTTRRGFEAKPSQMLALFVVAYLTQGICQHFCLLAQPLEYYLMRARGMTAQDVAGILSLMMLPYIVKPLYGLVSDFLPVKGSHHKWYLMLAHAGAFVAFVVAAGLKEWPAIFAALMVTCVAMAVSTTLWTGLTTQTGKDESGLTQKLFSIQGISYFVASISAALLGGWLAQHQPPESALKHAALISAAPSLVTLIATGFLFQEKRSNATPENAKGLLLSAWKAWLAGPLLPVLGFVCLYSFSPGFGVPQYYYQTNQLKFSQAFIGELSAWSSTGMLIGSAAFWWLSRKTTIKQQMLVAIVTTALSTIAYLALNETTAAPLEFARGVTTLFSTLAIYSVLSAASPRGVETLTMAVGIAVYNLAEQLSNYLGGYLYTSVLADAFPPLICIAAGTTALCLAFLPMLSARQFGENTN